MISDTRMTAEEFAANKHELPEGGRWHELHEGRPVLMDPPDDQHGTTVMNISRAIATWFQAREEQKVGYLCPEIGLKVAEEPDTVYCPALSFFDTGDQFAEFDKSIAEIVPRLVIDLASANDRRSEMRVRTLAYLALGVERVWVPDPYKKEVQVITRGTHTLALGDWQTLDGAESLPEFHMKVSEVFAQPDWWTKPSSN